MGDCVRRGAPEDAFEKVLLMESLTRGPSIYVGLENAHGPVTTNGPHKREDLVPFNRVDLINTVWKQLSLFADGCGSVARHCVLLDWS